MIACIPMDIAVAGLHLNELSGKAKVAFITMVHDTAGRYPGEGYPTTVGELFCLPC